MKTYLIELIAQPSTWRGIVMVLTSIGISINPELQAQIISAGLAIAGLIGASFRD